jgi:hypothetical protein
VVGIAVTFGYAIEVSLHSSPIPEALAESLVPRSYVHYMGGLVTVTGIASFFLPRGSDKTRQHAGREGEAPMTPKTKHDQSPS